MTKKEQQPTTMQLMQELYRAMDVCAFNANKKDLLQFEVDNEAFAVSTLRFYRDQKTIWNGRVENKMRDLIDVFLLENE